MIRAAHAGDAETLLRLINRAFLVERFFIDHDRIDLAGVLEFLAKGTFLLAFEDTSAVGCVYVEVRGDRGYFGLLSVEPERQGAGWGKRLIAAAEDHCRAAGCTAMDMQLVNLRQELPEFYHKLGYAENGTADFPADVETKLPCWFVKMAKAL